MSTQGGADPELITTYGENSPFAEAYRILQINLLQWHRNGKPIWSLGIAGARPRDGSSTVAANLGLIMRETGRRTVVVDGDLYEPSLHQRFQISNEVGFSTVLQGQIEAGRALQDVTDTPLLRVLPAGPKVRNPAALLQPEALKTLLDQLRGLADFLVIDLPSVSAVAYAPYVASFLDGLLLVVRAGTPGAGTDRLMKHRLQGVNVVGTVLNQLPVDGHEVSSYRQYARAQR
jgi:capsular exopolysaccharide synthesis family protein